MGWLVRNERPLPSVHRRQHHHLPAARQPINQETAKLLRFKRHRRCGVCADVCRFARRDRSLCLLRIIQNSSLLTTPALDSRSPVAPPLVTTDANDEHGFLGLAFHCIRRSQP